MKSASIWKESCSYIDCPYCKKTEVLGVEVVTDKTNQCPKCGETYEVEEEE